MERLGVAFAEGLQPGEIVECVKLAEEAGYESAWMAEGHGGDQFSILTACAAATERILLGTSISSVFVRTAPTIAMAAATVDLYSQGRFILGLGSSHKVQVEPEHGLTFGRPVQRMRECVDIVRVLLRDGEVSYRGEIYDIDNFKLWFEPYRKELPIYAAAVFPRMLEVCGEIAQGALLVWTTVEYSKAAAEHVAAGARRAGRDPSDVDVATMIPCAVSDDKDRARDSMRMAIASYVGRFPRYRRLMAEAGYADELEEVRRAWQEGDVPRSLALVPRGLIDSVTLVGAAEECRASLDAYRAAGIDLPIIFPNTSGPQAKAEAMEIIRACAPR
jgi:alkanesulfonate monooxygenase SsuD/methylene tetrahydromethanopterin reductase-like flavin-dependent oxidoreductase (luciferase family)